MSWEPKPNRHDINNLHQIIAYIKFLWRSSNQHGVHSPFVYGLVTRCFYDKKKHPANRQIHQYRKDLLESKEVIKVTDLGAGSKVFKTNDRSVSAIGKNAGITSSRARLLNRLVRYLKIKNALELGTSMGIGTAAMAAENDIRITTIEGCPETASVAREHLNRAGFHNLSVINGEFESVLKEWRTKKDQKAPVFDLIYIDGNHQKKPTLKYFQELLPLIHNDTVFIFDDIHWSSEMEEAWEEIKNHSAVTVSIDTFFWGFVFFRREQEKEHFVIRL